MSARISHPLADCRWRVRPPVERDDASVMSHFHQDDHIAGRLHNLGVTVITRSKAWRAERDAALAQSPVLRTSGQAFARGFVIASLLTLVVSWAAAASQEDQ